jgi:hypothetical protein
MWIRTTMRAESVQSRAVLLGLRVGLNVIADDFVHGQNISNFRTVCQLF